MKNVRRRPAQPVDSGGGVWYTLGNSILQTVEAEITARTPLQRAWEAENQVRHDLSNGPRRAQGKRLLRAGVCCDVGGRRDLPGICSYPAEGTGARDL